MTASQQKLPHRLVVHQGPGWLCFERQAEDTGSAWAFRAMRGEDKQKHGRSALRRDFAGQRVADISAQGARLAPISEGLLLGRPGAENRSVGRLLGYGGSPCVRLSEKFYKRFFAFWVGPVKKQVQSLLINKIRLE
jgi:hypothetical protein